MAETYINAVVGHQMAQHNKFALSEHETGIGNILILPPTIHIPNSRRVSASHAPPNIRNGRDVLFYVFLFVAGSGRHNDFFDKSSGDVLLKERVNREPDTCAPRIPYRHTIFL
ncbi:hypothetical protein EVAR_90166_1 [Eumeta japonica]|uniref:Uncharacterized protein n=1 Tax=Eumeta variegata TaxID=151549 RepID=A0A4C1WYM0_EUMVA|nr:hypothetical protein EVAR_90166_1 [Eumeta japonica]